MDEKITGRENLGIPLSKSRISEVQSSRGIAFFPEKYNEFPVLIKKWILDAAVFDCFSGFFTGIR